MAAPHSVFEKEWFDRRRGLLWWCVGVVGLVALQMLVYPTVREQAGTFDRLIETYPEPVKAMFGLDELGYSSGPGYLRAELFGFMAPLLFLIFAISQGTRATAGEEDGRTLDLLLSAPISRRRVVLEKFGALAASTAVLSVAFGGALAILAPMVRLRIGVLRLAQAVVVLALLALLFGALGLLMSVATGRRGIAAGITAALAVAGFLVFSLAPYAGWLDALRPFSPWALYAEDDPLRSGLGPLRAPALAALAIGFTAASAWAFDRRDLTR